VRLPRIQAIERELAHWLGYFERNPGERFVSDGDPDTVTVPAELRDRLRSELPRRLRICRPLVRPEPQPSGRPRGT